MGGEPSLHIDAAAIFDSLGGCMRDRAGWLPAVGQGQYANLVGLEPGGERVRVGFERAPGGPRGPWDVRSPVCGRTHIL